ncbi:uncharacterized protein LOC125943281 [Dermacentor silvarum]|uniref:uncharacterized protein LOC125943281 n=1 Tax=Dermacentor silvarum TaxID=543639 RepID=UPI002101B04A|nr:uncharacterized protein LOC125943281 [Dermacentor silvarum]
MESPTRCCATWRHLLLDAFNGVLRSGFPQQSWRCALVVPVLKRGKPPRSLASYRPVSLTSVPGKTMEAMALSRLQWIADIRGIFTPEQCGFRAHRSTADCFAAVVCMLEQASREGRAAYLPLLDVQSAFDFLPHATIISAVRSLGVEARLLAYVQALLTDRAERVPSNGHLPVRAVVRADDVALFVRGPPSAMRQMRMRLQAAVDAVGDFLRAIVLRLSAVKSEAIKVQPRAAARRHTGCVFVDGVSLPWRLTVRYLGLIIDHRLTWYPAVKQLRAAMRRVEGAVLYALPLCSLRPHLWRHIDCDHRRVLRMCHGRPRASRLAETLAEAGAWPVSLTADLRALGHTERLSRAPGAGPILSCLRGRPKSRVGKLFKLYDSLVVDASATPEAWPPPNQPVPLRVCLDLPGVRSKHRIPHCAVVQEAAARIQDDLVGRAHLYTDGSVRQDGSAAAACVVPHLDVARQCRLSYRASSTILELVGLHLAADILEESPFLKRVAIPCDSRSALRHLLLDERVPPLEQRVPCRLHTLQQPGCDLRIKWIPSHESADDLARCPPPFMK